MQELSTALAVNSEAKNRISNAIINGIFNMSTIEFRAICALASQVPKKEKDETIYSLTAKELAQLMNLNKKSSYAQLESVCREISGKTIVIEIAKSKHTKAWIPRKWFDFIVYDNGVVYYRFSGEIQPHLTLVRKAFVEIPSRLISEFKSFYGIRLFLLAKQWYDYARRKNQLSAKRKLTIDEIKIIFVLEGRYKSFSDLARFVLGPAIKEIEQLTQLRLPFTVEKSKTKVTGVVFNVTEVVDTVVVIENKTDEKEIQARELMSQCRCNARTINRLISQHSPERIIRWAEYTLARDGIKNPAAYLTEMLKKDYEDSNQAVVERPKVVKAQEQENDKIKSLKSKEIVDPVLEDAFRKFRGLGEEEQTQIYELILQGVDGFFYKALSTCNAQNILEREAFRCLFLKKYSEFMENQNDAAN